MSTPTETPSPRGIADEGFSLVEILVAIVVFAVVAFSALPVLMTGIKASTKARTETLAKDVTTLRIERMRNLPFQVDQQNGPYVDLLDRYFTNVSGAVSGNGEAGCSGRYLASSPGTDGGPTGPAYQVVCSNLPEAAGYTQTVYTQFLRRTGVSMTPTGTYNSQVAGRDDAPSKLVGVTVLTTWSRNGQTGRLRTYTEIADAGTREALLTTQAQAVALRVAAEDPSTGTSYVAQAGHVKADGSLTSGSIASVQTTPASIQGPGLTATSGAARSVLAPTTGATANPAGTTDQVDAAGITSGTVAGGAVYGTWYTCGWSWFGRSASANVSSTTTGGRPVVPSTNGVDATTSTSAFTTAGLLNNGSSCAGYSFGFRNWLTVPTYTAGLGILTDRPLVYIPDSNSGGSAITNGPLRARAGVSATDLGASPRSASAAARAAVSTVHVLPVSGYPDGLVRAQLNSASITCKSGNAVTAGFELVVTYPGGTKTIALTSTGATTDSLPEESAVAFTVNGLPRTLDDYLDWDVRSSIASDSSGARALDYVFSVRVPGSVVGGGGVQVQLGTLSCSARDNR